MMDVLYQLSKLNSRQKRVCESLLPSDQDGPLNKLYQLISSGKVLDDEQAMNLVYSTRNTTAFYKLKLRLADIFYKAMILQNNTIDTADSRVNEAINGYRQTLVSRMLISNKSTELGIQIAERTIIQAMKFHATENVLLLSRSLVIYYGQSGYNKYKLNKYSNIQETYLKQYEYELKAENYVRELQVAQLRSMANPKASEIELALQYKNDLDAIENVRSFHFNYNKFKVNAIYYEFIKDYQGLLELIHNTTIEFSASDFKAASAFNTITLRRSWALIQAGELKQAIEMGSKELKKLPEGTNAWYFLAHYTLKALIYNESYTRAAELITNMFNQPRFKQLAEHYQELFITTLGYLHLVNESGLIKDNEQKLDLPDFKLYKFLNTTPAFSKDKRGINVSILLMHIAFLLQRKDYNAIIDKMDSLNQYSHRYLRKDDSFRSNCIIKMVIQITRADFHPVSTARYTSELKNQLKSTKVIGSGENIEVEIIPFETLWQIMERALEK